jgi:hypothetical protein
MSSSPTSRYFVRYDLTLRPQRDQGAPLPLRDPGDGLDVLSVLKRALADGTAVLNVTEGEDDFVRLTAVEYRPRSNLVALLFRRSTDGSAPIFEHRRTKALRKSDKKDDEAEAYSAHLFISLDSHDAPYPTHRAVLEEVAGLGRTYIQELLRRILRPVVYPYVDERRMDAETYTIPQMGGVASETVKNAIKGGGIKYIELVRAPRLDGMDTAGLVASPERLRLSIKSNRQGSLDMVRRVKAWAGNHGWDRIRVQVETKDERTRVVEIAREADAADVLFVRAELIDNINPPLEKCTDQVVDAMVSKARKLLSSNVGWKG